MFFFCLIHIVKKSIKVIPGSFLFFWVQNITNKVTKLQYTCTLNVGERERITTSGCFRMKWNEKQFVLKINMWVGV